MFKKISKIILSLTMVMTLVLSNATQVHANSQNDIETIKDRLKEYFLGLDTIDDGAKVETCYVSQAEDYLTMMQEDGSFADVNYKATNNAANGVAWSPYLALDRLQAIAIAYHKEGNAIYQKEEAKVGIEKALKHWITQGSRSGKPAGPYSTNWWENEVGVQLRFSRIGLFMEDVISEETFNIILEKLIEKTPVKKGTGQNNLWFDQNHVYHSLLINNATRLKEMVDDYLNYCLSTQLDDITKEAVQVDNSFYMHGKQFYSNGYGMTMFRDMSFWIYMLRNTEFSIGQDVVERMGNYMLNGTSWTIRGDIMELYLGYRPYKYDVGYKNYSEEYIEPLKRMIESDPLRANEYKKVLENIEGTNSNGKDGNYYMWRSGYASHMRDNYGVNIKMDSKEIIGGEWRGSWSGQEDQGQLIYWTSSAASTITVDGDEYTKVFPVYDWAHCPGTTTASRIVKDYANYGRFTNGTNHTIGVTNGKYGATSYVMNKKDTQATKGYFFFDDEFVALGAGIQSKEGVNIHTTLNQSEANNVSVNGEAVVAGTKNKEYTTRSLYNDKVGYVFLDDTKVVVSNDGQKNAASLWPKEQKEKASNVFKAYIDHGLKPTNGTYAYVVVPDTTKEKVSKYANNVPVEVLANDKNVQAVRHDGLKQTQIHFYKAGSLEYKSGYTVTVDQPCSVIIDESGATREISVAVNDQSEYQDINVKLSYENTSTTTQFVTKGIPYAGQTVTLSEEQDNKCTASSRKNGHEARYVIDGNLNTYWESEGNSQEWISIFAGSHKYIKDINILWGENYATQYDVYASKDGYDYKKIESITDGKGNTENITIGGLYKYIKLVMNNSNGSSYQIKEVKFSDSQLLSLNKTVTVSSTSTNDPGNIKENAVDGNSNTRWSSLRMESGFNKQEEWISVDLGRQARIDAIELLWEAACSHDFSIEVSDDNKTWKNVKQNLKPDSSLKNQIVLDEAVEGRYVRIHSYSSATKYGISIYELSIYGQNISKNIALNKAVDSSSIYGSEAVMKAVDGDIKSKWSSSRKNPGFDTQEEWIRVDLGQVSYIDGVKIDWETGSSNDYSIEISDDNENWTTVKEHLKSNTVASTNNHYIDNIQFDKVLEARYIKIHSSSSRTKYGINIWELNVLGEIKDIPEIEEKVNIAFNKPSLASSEYIDTKDGNKQYFSSLAFDGSTGKVDSKQSRWTSNRDSHNEWIQVDLEDLYLVDSLILNWEGTNAHEYKVLVSKDNEEWEEIEHIRSGAGIKEIKFDEPMKARYIKMQGVKVGGKYGYSLWEFEVYGELAKDTENANIAFNKTSKASSEYIDAKEGNKQYFSSLAFDGNYDKVDSKQSRWASNRKTNDEWIYVDLEDIYDISKIILDWEEACGKDYNIQVSLDGETWTTISEVRGNSAPKNSKHNVREYLYDQDVYARYVKMQGIAPAGNYGYSLWEFEVYGMTLKESLKEYYDQNKDIDTTAYTPKSVKAYTDALENIDVVYNDKHATSSQLLDAKQQLKNAIDGLTLKADKIALENIIKNTDDMTTDIYTKKTVKVLEEALKEAKKVDADENATESQVNKAIEQLQKAINELVKKADKSLLDVEIKKAEAIDTDLYTNKTVQSFKEALKQAQDINQDENATQSQVNKAIEQLQKAIKGLIKKADKSILDTEIQKAEAINKDLYTKETVKVLEKVLKEAQKITKDENATQDQIDEIIKKIQEATQSLEKKKDEEPGGPIIEVPTRPEDNVLGDIQEPEVPISQENEVLGEAQNPNTSDSSFVSPYIIAIGISFAVYMLLKKKKEVK